MKTLLKISAVMLAVTVAGCAKPVPSGHVGRVQGTNGFSGDALAPGHHTCYGRDVMKLMEVTDKRFDIPMQVLCKDQLNFKFNVGILVSVDKSKKDLIKEAFENVVPANGSTITIEQLFKMYVEPVVDQEARKIVSRYETKEIASKREEVIASVRTAATKAIDSGLLKVKRITINNMDFPDIITQAQEAKAQRQVEVETMKAETDKQLEKARGQLRVAQVEYERRLVEAAMIADSNKIIGSSITPGFLAWHELKVLGKAAQGPNNWGFIPYSNNAQNVLKTGDLGQVTLDAQLLDRVNKAKAKAGKDPAETPAPVEAAAPPK